MVVLGSVDTVGQTPLKAEDPAIRRPGVEVLDCVSQRVRLALAAPDGTLVLPGQRLDRLGCHRLSCQLPVVVPIRAHRPDRIWIPR